MTGLLAVPLGSQGETSPPVAAGSAIAIFNFGFEDAA